MLEAERGRIINTHFVALVTIAKSQEHYDPANNAIIELADALIEAGVFDLDQLKSMARDAMLARKPVNLLNGQ